MAPVRARHAPVTTALSDPPGASSLTRGNTEAAAANPRHCVVCGAQITAVRPTARSCSGRCRITLSRTRRVADLVQRLAAAEAALTAAESAVTEAGAAVRDLRALAEQGGAKVAP